MHPIQHNLWGSVPAGGNITENLHIGKLYCDDLTITYPVISFSVGLARPKSKIFSSQSSLTAILDGLRSLKLIENIITQLKGLCKRKKKLMLLHMS